MKSIVIGNKKIEIYDTIEDLPILRFHKYNKMLLIDAAVGSGVDDIFRHVEKTLVYMRQGKNDLAEKEISNLTQNIAFVQEEISPRFMAFAVLVKSINGESRNDISDEGLKRTMQIISDISVSDIAAQFGAAKKKIDEELRAYFPALFDDGSVKEYSDTLKRRTMALLETIINGRHAKEDRDKVQRITDELVTYTDPQSFGEGSDNAEIAYDRKFENMCLLLSSNLNVNAKQYTVLEFYNAFEYMKTEARRARKANGAK